MAFVLAFLQRVLSGLQSMFGYNKAKLGFIVSSIAIAFYPFFNYDPHWLFFLFIAVNIFVVYMKTISFDLFPKVTLLAKYKDIHLWENLVTGGYFIYLVLAHFNILLLLCTVYPSLILHKGLINIGSKLPFFASATDDPTGKTYGFKLFGFKIKRSSNTYRLILAGLSIIAAIVIFYFGLSVKL